jgi:chaperonin GroES
MSGSAARRYLITEQTQEYLAGTSASAILNNLSAGAFGEVGDEHAAAPIESRPRKPVMDDTELPELPSERLLKPEQVEAQLVRMGMNGQQYAGLLDPEAVSNVIPFPGMQAQPQDQGPYGKNLAVEMDSGKLTDLGNRVRSTYAIDEYSRSEWLRGYDKALELVDYQSKVKNYPIEGAANIKYPLLIMASLQFAARAYPAIVRPGNMVRMKVEGFEPEMPDPRQMDPAKAATPDGQREIKLMILKSQKSERASRVSRYLSWQLRSQIREWEEETDRLLHTLPLVGCAFRKTYQSAGGRKRSMLVSAKDIVIKMDARSVEEAPRITQKFNLYPYELQTKIRAGDYLDIREELNLDFSNDEDNQKPIAFIEQHCRYDLDGDGYDEPVVITVHQDSGTVARIEVNYDEADIRRTQDGTIIEIVPTQIFTKYDFLPNPLGGIYGVGFGHVLRDITDSINTTLNQIFDAAHLQNSAGGFIAKGLRFGRGEQGEQLHVAQNRYHYVNSAGPDLRTQIVNFEHKGPSPTLFQVLGLLIEAGKDIAAIKDILTGDTAGASNLPVGTTLALIEQGMQVFTAIYKRIFRAMSREFGVLYQINSKYLDINEYMVVTDDPRASEEDFTPGDHDLTPVSDPNVVTDMQKLGRAQYLQQFLQDPLLSRRAIYKRIFDAASIEDPEELFAPPDEVQEQLAMLQLQRTIAENENIVADTGLKKAQSVKNLSDASSARVDAAYKDREADQKDREIDVKEQQAKKAANGKGNSAR